MATCKMCGAPIIWIKTPRGKMTPVDEGLKPYRENPDGKSYLVNDRGETIRCDLYPDDKVPAGEFPTGMARMSHWATCPHAEDFKKKKAGG